VPRCGIVLDLPRFRIPWQQVFGRLEPDVLHRICIDLGSDQRFHGIENARISQQREHCRTGPERGIGTRRGLRQRKVEVLGVIPAALGVDFGEPLGEGEILVQGADLAAGEEIAREPIEHTLVFLDDGIEVPLLVQHATKDEVALLFECGDLVRCQ
jgi:hypothetical protein